uniref:HD domain-containing protein n=1 Tax=Oryzias latipes TaxID=8090 RepID=A0A3P9JXV2_ORYLA
MEFFSQPFIVSPDLVPEHLQMEFIEFQCDTELRRKFVSLPLRDFYPNVSLQRYPQMRKNAQLMLSLFGSTYICEQTFSLMNLNEIKLRGTRTDSHWQDILTLSVFNDSIHGHVELHPLLVQIIDTPQFQRLRYIKQFSGGYFVYPGASHNRFEHSIGVAYLAGLQAKTLRENQPDLEITDEDILCVEIAGLCHDLGHGPFSHLFDQMFMPQACKNEEWKHEDASVKMFEYLLEKNKDIQKYLTEMKKPRDEDDNLVFIKELIFGETKSEVVSSRWQYKGRGEDKSFLYEIVSNKQNGIDVDKFDYFARDCHYLGLKNNFDHMRYFKFTRVIEVETDERKHICSRDKEADNLYDLFYTRNRLHRRACQHRVKMSVDIMIKDALLKANNLIQFEGRDEQFFTISKAKNDMEAYTQLTGHRPELESSSSELKQAKNILKRIMRRDLYKLVGEAKVGHFNNSLYCITYDYGKGDKDPVGCCYFYNKHEPQKAFHITRQQVSNFLPDCFWEQTIRLYWKSKDETHLDAVVREFKVWCYDNGFQVIFRPAMLEPPQDGAQHQGPSRKRQKVN